MRRSFGPGMGGGGGRGGGGTMKTVHRAIRAGLTGGACQESYSHSATTTTRTTTGTNRNQPINTTLSLSSTASPSSPRSSYYSHPVPAPPNWPEEFEWEYIHGGDGESLNHVIYDDFVSGSVPSMDEVHHAVSSLHEVLDPIIENKKRTYGAYDDGIEKISGSELDWIEPSWQSTLHDPSSTRVYDAFHLLQTDPSVQRMVISLSSDKAVWDAVMNNEVVRELRESVIEGKSNSECSEDSSVDDTNPVTQVLRWMFVNTKEKAIEIVDKITKMVNELVRVMGKDEKPKTDTDHMGTDHSFEEKLRSSFLLSIMVLLIVVVSRAHKC